MTYFDYIFLKVFCIIFGIEGKTCIPDDAE